MAQLALCPEQLLLSDCFAPTTSEIGFLEAEIEVVAKTFASWTESILRGAMRDDRGEVHRLNLEGDLPNILKSLFPLRSLRANRFVFVQTHSPWVAYFDNSSRGTDAFPVVSQLAQTVGCRGLRVVGIPHTFSSAKKESTGRYGALVLEVYGPRAVDGGLNVERTIGVVNDAGRWVFDQGGSALPFEDTDQYKKKAVLDRFTYPMMDEYCRSLGIRPFEDGFYAGRATHVQCVSKLPKNARDFTLEEVRKYLGLV